MRRWAHDWFSYERYQVVHASYMNRLIGEALVERDGISFYESVDPRGELVLVTIRGRLTCRDSLSVRVDKKLNVRRGQANRHEVRTFSYQYHAWVRQRPGSPRRDVVRYDNSLAHDGTLHRHLFDRDGRETAIESVPVAEMPTLDEFVRLAVARCSG